MPLPSSRAFKPLVASLAFASVTLLFGLDPAAAAQQQAPAANAGPAAGTQAPAALAAQQPPARVPVPMQLGVGDLIEMTVYGVPDLNNKARVTSNGDLYCPLIGFTHVAGLTIEEAQELIGKRLSEYLKNPQISLLVTEYASQGVSVLGAVARPGVYPVLGQQHLFDLISAAGGLNEKAGRSLTVTHRSDPDKTITVDLTRDLKDNPETNIQIYPGDTIIVRKADIIYVVGDVARPSGLLMDGGTMTVLQAVALAGGTNRTAKLSGVRILHKSTRGTAETQFDLKKILQAKAPDLPLHPDDILVIPFSSGKVIAGATLAAALQAATLLSVAAVP